MTLRESTKAVNCIRTFCVDHKFERQRGNWIYNRRQRVNTQYNCLVATFNSDRKKVLICILCIPCLLTYFKNVTRSICHICNAGKFSWRFARETKGQRMASRENFLKLTCCPFVLYLLVVFSDIGLMVGACKIYRNYAIIMCEPENNEPRLEYGRKIVEKFVNKTFGILYKPCSVQVKDFLFSF